MMDSGDTRTFCVPYDKAPCQRTVRPGTCISSQRQAAMGSGPAQDVLIQANEVPVTLEAMPPASTTVTCAPLLARWYANDAPTMPAPTTMIP